MDAQRRRTLEAVLGVGIFVMVLVILIVGVVAYGEIPYGPIALVMAVGWIISLWTKRAAKRDR
jgi:protein-S-isoprenylcysteine O-methyltransferase Ste14